MKPKVYFSRLRDGQTRLECLNVLLDAVDNHLSMFRDGVIVGVKITVGDVKGTAYVKPELVGAVVKRLSLKGAKPFLFDTNVIYRGQRMNAVDHMNLAYSKGFSPEKIGCPYIVVDGVFGTDSKAIKVNFKNLKEIRIPSFIEVLEDLVVLSHITGHIASGYAASVKNVGMGMASRAGKQIQHSSLKPQIDRELCTMCGCCVDMCPVSAISEKDGKAFIEPETCVGCCECIAACKFGSVSINWQEDTDLFVEKMAEYACGILSRIKRKFFFNFAFDITKECDCVAEDIENPVIAGDRGVLASEDILALDKASFDLLTEDGDVFARGEGKRSYLHQFRYSEEIGLGTLDYELIRL